MKTKHREKFFLIMVSSLTTLAIFFPYTTFCVSDQAGSDNSVTNTIIIEIIIISIIIALLFTQIKRKINLKQLMQMLCLYQKKQSVIIMK